MTPSSLSYEFTQDHRAYARAWLAEYYRAPRWGLVRALGGPLLVLVGYQLTRLRPGEWIAAFGSFAVGFGIYYAFKPAIAVAMLVVRRHRLGAHRQPTVVTVDGEGIGVRSGGAESRIGWDAVERAGLGGGELWLELRTRSRALLPLPEGEQARTALGAILREQGHGAPEPSRRQ